MSSKKKLKEFDKILKSCVKKREVVIIERDVTDGESNLSGVIWKVSNNFIHLNETDEFKFNGEVIIRKDQFESITCSQFNRTYKEILEKEGLLSKKKPSGEKLNLSDWASIFSDLKKKNIHVIVECENLKDPSFTIGPIEKIGKKEVEIRYYDPHGILDKKVTKIKFKDITTLRFNDRYSKIFRKYLIGATK